MGPMANYPPVFTYMTLKNTYTSLHFCIILVKMNANQCEINSANEMEGCSDVALIGLCGPDQLLVIYKQLLNLLP